MLFNDFIEEKLFNTPAVITALALGGIFMIALDKIKFDKPKNKPENKPENKDEDDSADTLDITSLSWKQALFIGFMQCVAMWPGTSRSMMTIAGGVLVGLKPKQAAEFSFLLGLPTLGGACVYSLMKNLKHASETGTPNMFETLGWMPITVGIVVATISASLAVRWLVSFLNRHGLAPFGYYRLVLAALLGILIATGTVSLDAPTAEPTPLLDLDQ